MKIILSTFMFAVLFAGTLSAQSPKDKKAVQQTILRFAEAGDQQNADQLDELLHEQYRVVMNQLFGSDQTTVMDKEGYLSKIRNKEFGGDQRKVSIERLQIIGKNASAEVHFVGQKLSMHSLLQLVQDAQGKWRLIQDLPSVN